ncbi:MAG: class I SAM-dependent methyltransferase [Candidatus Eisenbacteria bacterium]|uniref:Class I SAM-dependent methyltransferase n=1 Tax=Eiseniibacteriota bacterium TaxID=2212470 RepID=A0A849STP1_UNCEI|nr:class I SAM-dependent methyltransferase [Candidatus Eisenbacteria bacterium]
MREKWDQRYSESESPFGFEPNDFVVEVADLIPPGAVLCLAEGQGRNAVYLAGRGHRVTAMDLSPVGLAAAERLALERGVRIVTECADLEDYAIAEAAWAGIVSVWVQVERPLREAMHRAAARGLAPGGVLVIEAYTPSQLERATGGPPDGDRFPTLADLRRELDGLEFEVAREHTREIHEGRCHNGTSDVVQVVARRPRPVASGV